MIRSLYSVVACALVIAWCPPASADTPDDNAEVLKPGAFDPSTCGRASPASPKPTVEAPDTAPVPVTWNDFELTGDAIDPTGTVRALFAPTLGRHRALTEDARGEIVRAATAFGYHVVGIGTRETPTGTHLSVHLAPLPMVRRVYVDIKDSGAFKTLLDDEVKRRMRLRPGAYVAWEPRERACELYDETRRIEEFLHDEGFFEARATIAEKFELGRTALTLKITVYLGDEYTTALDKIQFPDAGRLSVDVDELREKFRHPKCLIGKRICWGILRFTRAQHTLDVQAVVDLFHDRGFPAVRVRSDFDPGMSIDRRTHTVRFSITIDPRRRLDVVFEGDRSPSDPTLRKQLTFNKAASADDVEANDSAKALAAYLQSRGYFDARVTWTRERFSDPEFDNLIFRIEQGKSRVVRSVLFVGNQAIATSTLSETVGTKPARLSTSLFGANTAATSTLLAADVDRLAALYRRSGYRDARIRVSASTDPNALGSAALTAALISADRGSGLYVRFSIEEGQPTLLTQVHVELGEHGDQLATPEDHALCTKVLRDLADLYHHEGLAKQANPDRCVATAVNLPFKEDAASDTRDLLKDRLFSRGRPRAEIAYEPVVLGPHRIAAHYKLANIQELKTGKVVIRGNFHTRDWIILKELRLKEGEPLTKDALADGARRLRNTGLFEAVNIALPDLDTASTGEVNAVVEITERFDYRASADAEIGYSSYNSAFFKLIPSLKNLFGIGVSLDVAGTIGFDLGELIGQKNVKLRQLSLEATLRIPQFLSPIGFDTELTAFHRRQDTPRFGLLKTTGVTIAMSKTWNRPRVGTIPARALTLGFHYDLRSRERNVDVLRPIGADDDDSQVPITTNTGSVGVTGEWEQRVDRRGTLSTLAPESGFRLEGSIAYYHPALTLWLDSQDTFIKVSAGASKYWLVGSNLILRADLRYDQGFPLGGAALLPEVERFFAGGDSTVRGYDDDRLATEIIQVGVPPLDNITQIRILPAGGNIRLMGSVDAQLRIWRLFSSALFVDAGVITNQFSTVTTDDIRPSVGMALIRIVTPFGAFAFERAVTLRPRLGDDPRGRWHLSFAARAQF